MKKILLAISLISVLLLAGCNKNEKIENSNTQETQNEQQIEVTQSISYTNEQLIEMVNKYLEAKGKYIPDHIEISDESGDIVTIHLYDDTVEEITGIIDWYSINRNTGKGTNVLDETIDLTIILNDNWWFITDSTHCDTPGGFGGAMPEMYYFASDNTYSWVISDYIQNERVVAKKGTWKIENNKLILHEQEETYLDGGDFIEVKDDPMLGDDTVLVGYTVINRHIDNVVEHSIQYVGLSDYSKSLKVGGKDIEYLVYEYKMDDKTMYSGVNVSKDIFEWISISQSFNENYLSLHDINNSQSFNENYISLHDINNMYLIKARVNQNIEHNKEYEIGYTIIGQTPVNYKVIYLKETLDGNETDNIILRNNTRELKICIHVDNYNCIYYAEKIFMINNGDVFAIATYNKTGDLWQAIRLYDYKLNSLTTKDIESTGLYDEWFNGIGYEHQYGVIIINGNLVFSVNYGNEKVTYQIQIEKSDDVANPYSYHIIEISRTTAGFQEHAGRT